MTCVVLLGPPGAGKGTQAQHIADVLHICSMSTGAVFRHHMKEDTKLGKIAQQYINAGEFVPDEITNKMVESDLANPDCANGFLLDGYPRNLDQARFLDQALASLGKKVDLVLQILIPKEAVVERLLKRAEIEGREDDTEPVIRRRIEVYREQTKPISEFYEKAGVLRTVDGTGTIEEVRAEIDRVLADFI